jgi:hypothetical protein
MTLFLMSYSFYVTVDDEGKVEDTIENQITIEDYSPAKFSFEDIVDNFWVRFPLRRLHSFPDEKSE